MSVKFDKKRVTISDVAKYAGVSPSTVSRVINRKDGDIKISPKTEKLIWDAVQMLQYTPNPFATALRTNKTGIIGLIIRDIGNPFLQEIVQQIHAESQKANLELLIGHAGLDLKTAQRQIALMNNLFFDGLIFLGNIPGDEAMLENSLQQQMPFVSIRGGDYNGGPVVTYDHERGVKLALEHLQSLGHKRIAFIGNIEHNMVADRLQAFQSSLAQYGMTCQESHYLLSIKNRSDAVGCVKHLFESDTPPTALFCCSDLLALGAMSGAWQIGKKVPEDVSIIGFDDIEEAKFAYPPLTTIQSPKQLAAQKAIEILLRLIDGNEIVAAEKHIISPSLVIRDSCAPAKPI